MPEDLNIKSDVPEFPVIFEVEAAAEWFAEHPEAITNENVGTALSRVGRNPAPSLLYLIYGLQPQVAAVHAGPAWSMCEYPFQVLTKRRWLQMFTAAGYTVDGVRAERPVEPITLYRGCTSKHARGWSWTDNQEVAERYAHGTWYWRLPGHVYVASIAPAALLACNTERNEHEYVVNTSGLNLRRLSDAERVQVEGAQL